jgi:hypothetical protein
MSDPLATYLHDHLAGSHFAIQLIDTLRERQANKDLSEFANILKADISQDQDTLQGIVDAVGKIRVDVKEAAGWLSEKASRLKLQQDESGTGLGTFEALETLSLGIRGKQALWRVLPVVRGIDKRVPELDYEMLARRAEEQFSRVEDRRVALARTAFVQQA